MYWLKDISCNTMYQIWCVILNPVFYTAKKTNKKQVISPSCFQCMCTLQLRNIALSVRFACVSVLCIWQLWKFFLVALTHFSIVEFAKQRRGWYSIYPLYRFSAIFPLFYIHTHTHTFWGSCVKLILMYLSAECMRKGVY